MRIELIDEFDWRLLYPLNISVWLPKFLNLKSDSHYDLILSTGSFGIEPAITLVNLLRSLNITYDVHVKRDSGSVSTVLACGAKTIFFNKGASLSSLDPSVPTHFFPRAGDLQYCVNPAEVRTLLDFVERVCSPQDYKVLYDDIDHFCGGNIENASLKLRSIQNQLKEILPVNLSDQKKERITGYLTVGAGSWDTRIYFQDLRRIGLDARLLEEN